MKKRSFRSTFVSVILVITVAISIVNLAVYGINIKKIRQVEVLKMKTAGERIDDMITISLNNIKGLKQILVKDNGCGIDSEKREELNRILCERTRRISYIDEEEKSIGINNVNTRIKNYYGEKYGVKVNKADKGTEIQLLLGIENLEEENKDK